MDQHAKDLLELVAQHSNVTNMGLERLLAQIKKSVAHSSRKPVAERVVCSGTLCQLMANHIARGGDDLRGQMSREQLLQEGVKVTISINSPIVSVEQRSWLQEGSCR